MESKELIKMNLDMGFGMTLQMVGDMKDSATVFPSPKGGCHPLWLLGHLAYSEGTMLQQFMLGEENPLAEWKEIFADGTEPSADASKYPPFDEVLAKLQETHQKSVELLESFSEADLDTPSKGCPEQYQAYFGTYRQCFSMIAAHCMMHRGQLADTRRAAGLKRAGP